MESKLLRKLLIKPGHRLLIVHLPENAVKIIGTIPKEIEIAYKSEGAFDSILLFSRNSDELKKGLTATTQNRKPQTIIWSIYPRKASNIPTDLHAMKPWEALADFGLEIVASAGINNIWTAVRLRPFGQSKASGMCLADIANSAYSKFIDVANRTVTMPDDMNAVIAVDKASMAWFEQLSFSNKKEYVLWVLSAKQEKNRRNRIAQSLIKLAAHKKNPSDK